MKYFCCSADERPDELTDWEEFDDWEPGLAAKDYAKKLGVDTWSIQELTVIVREAISGAEWRFEISVDWDPVFHAVEIKGKS